MTEDGAFEVVEDDEGDPAPSRPIWVRAGAAVLVYDIVLRYAMRTSTGSLASLADAPLATWIGSAGIWVGFVLHLVAGSRWPLYLFSLEAVLRGISIVGQGVSLVRLFSPALVLATCGFLLASDPVRAWFSARRERRRQREAGPAVGVASFALALLALVLLTIEVVLAPGTSNVVPLSCLVVAFPLGLISLPSAASRRRTLGMWGTYLSGASLLIVAVT